EASDGVLRSPPQFGERAVGRSTPESLWSLAAVMAAVAMMLIAGSRIRFADRDPDPQLVLLGIVALVASRWRLSPLVLAWWTAGTMTLLWTLAPANTFAAVMWETTYLAAFLAGRTPIAFWVAASLMAGSRILDAVL